MNWDEDELKTRGLIDTGFHLPYNPDLTKRAKWLRKNMTLAEKKLWYNFLRKFSIKIFRQRPIDNFIVDFYCPKARLVIEIDGDDHQSSGGIEYDKERTSVLEGYGLRVIRFKNEEVLNQFRDVCRKLEDFFAPPW